MMPDSELQVVKKIVDAGQKEKLWDAEVTACNEVHGLVDVIIKSSGTPLKSVIVPDQLDARSLTTGKKVLVAKMASDQYICLGSFTGEGYSKVDVVPNHDHSGNVGSGGTLDAWHSMYTPWSFVSLNSFSISGDYRSIFLKDTNIRCKVAETGASGYRYFTVTANSTLSIPNTVISLQGIRSTDVLANYDISDTDYSYVTPEDIPATGKSSWTPSVASSTAEEASNSTSFHNSDTTVSVVAGPSGVIMAWASAEIKSGDGAYTAWIDLARDTTAITVDFWTGSTTYLPYTLFGMSTGLTPGTTYTIAIRYKSSNAASEAYIDTKKLAAATY
jgi:hypothetical protein